MSHTSQNPRGSALSPHALSILRSLLRRIALAHRNSLEYILANADGAPGEANETSEREEEPRVPTIKDPLPQHLDQPYSSVPTARALTTDAIATAITMGTDPWAEDADTGANNQLSRAPVRKMLVAARFAALLSTPEFVDAILAPRACTSIVMPSASDRRRVYHELEDILDMLSDIHPAAWKRLRVFILDSANHTPKQQKDFRRNIDYAATEDRQILALLPDHDLVSPVLELINQRTLAFPDISAELLIEILRVTHSATGEVAVDALKSILPADAVLMSLPPAVIEHAFRAETTIAVAQTLAQATSRVGKTGGVTLENVVLNSNVQRPVEQLVADVAAWKSRSLAWEEVTSSILFYGPPGNGKTLLASAIAGSLNVPLIATSYSECQKHGHQGDMLRALSEKVEEAIIKAPCVFFLDELDSFSHRNSDKERGTYIIGVVNGLLEHLTRLNNTPGIIALGATNYLNMIDPAIIRPGRFDRHIEITNPDRVAIVRILEHAIGQASRTFDLTSIADQLLGSSGAAVTTLVREARGLARGKNEQLKQSHLETAANRISPALTPDILWRTAIHESGHLVVATALGLPAPKRASLTANGGHVKIPAPLLETRDSTLNRICTLLAGHAAEKHMFGQPSNGAGNGPDSDLAIATELAVKLLTEWGLEGQLSHMPGQYLLKSKPDTRTDHPVEHMLRDCLDTTSKILEENTDQLMTIATALLEEREFSEKRCREVLIRVRKIAGGSDAGSPKIPDNPPIENKINDQQIC